jgi:hypothetical protein
VTTRDPHQRFGAWLAAGAPGEPARDLALHAWVCEECSARIAGLDRLAAIDPARAGIPAMPRVNDAALGSRRSLRQAARFAGAVVGVLLMGTLVGLGAGQLLNAPGTNGGDEGAEQGLLGATGRPSLATTLSPTPAPQSSPAASHPNASRATATPIPATVAPLATLPPAITPPPATQPPAATAKPSATARPTATPSPSSQATASPTSAPTASPTAAPTLEPSPTAAASASVTPET